ncbi:AGAP002762-PA-like protein [Anopheles sinensis]|uniref:T-complex protein 1 subunit eta n=1 Tax=Anopheles sinensis TaxID=74873 RepID=A0A084VWM2_ANOSI|nr:AGAP002762-PA-like protein [Anopheles sinensis]
MSVKLCCYFLFYSQSIPPILVVILIGIAGLQAEELKNEATPAQDIRLLLEDVKSHLNRFNSHYLINLEQRIVSVLTTMTSLDSNVKTLQEKSQIWDVFQHHIGAWSEHIKSVDSKLDILKNADILLKRIEHLVLDVDRKIEKRNNQQCTKNPSPALPDHQSKVKSNNTLEESLDISTQVDMGSGSDESTGDDNVQPQIILLKEGTDTSQGKPQLVSNINACQTIVDAVRTTLGPRGMDKLIVDSKGKATISNDGATIMKLLDIVHPAAKTLVDIAKSQDAEVGDGTTSVVLLAGEFLKQLKPFVEEGVHPRIIIKAVRKALNLCVAQINELAFKIEKHDSEKHRALLEKCAATALNSKLIHQQKEFFSKMVVDTVTTLDVLLPLNMIGIKKVTGGALEDSLLIEGVAFKKTFAYAGFEMQPKSYDNVKIALLNIELELKAERDNAEVRVDNVSEYQKVVDAEWQILYDKLAKIHQSGAQVVLSKLPIGDVATQYFADRDMFCAGRVPDEDLKRTQKACGGAVMTTVQDISEKVLGNCAHFEERQIGSERFNLFQGCPNAKTCTIILRGGAEQFLEETERSLHDAIMIVRRTIRNDSVVAGGGAIEMELSKMLRNYSRTIAGKEQLLIGAMAKALEVIPRQLCDNAGFDATNILNKLRQKHAQGCQWYGVDIMKEHIADNFEAFVWEPSVIKINALTAACEATCMILSVDETIKSPQSGGGEAPQPPMGRGMGRPF